MRRLGDYTTRTAVVVRTRVSSQHIPGTCYAVHIYKHQTGYRIRGIRGSVSRRKSPCEQRLPHYTCTSRATPSSCDGGEAQFPMERGSIATHHPAWNTQCTLKSRKLLCPKPNVMPRFSRGDVGQARWLLSHRRTETSPILPVFFFFFFFQILRRMGKSNA